jgi:hypothetical protein
MFSNASGNAQFASGTKGTIHRLQLSRKEITDDYPPYPELKVWF